MKQHEPYFDKIASALRREPGRFEIFLEAPYPELRSIDEVPLGPSEESVMKRLSKELKIHLKTFRSGFFSMDTLRKLGNKRKASIAIAYWTKDLIDSLEGLGYTKQRAREIVLKGAQTKASRLGIELEYFQGILQSISGKRIPSKEIAEAILEIRDISNVSMERTIRNGLKESKASKFIFVVGGQHFSAVKRAHNRYLREKEKSVSGTP
ncbi:MAG: hypothetical protein NT067_02085 [Candidatus Diapherotrites archaeon]|nr:hypothetical protein [Candidatus Diapherotrites archaeon]